MAGVPQDARGGGEADEMLQSNGRATDADPSCREIGWGADRKEPYKSGYP
jgi:hypothetical protein